MTGEKGGGSRPRSSNPTPSLNPNCNRSKSTEQIVEILLINGHELCDEGLQVKDLLAPQRDTMLVERRPLHDLSLDGIVQRREQVHDERLQYHLSGDAVD